MKQLIITAARNAEHLLCAPGSNEQTGVSTYSVSDGLKGESAVSIIWSDPVSPEKASRWGERGSGFEPRSAGEAEVNWW